MTPSPARYVPSLVLAAALTSALLVAVPLRLFAPALPWLALGLAVASVVAWRSFNRTRRGMVLTVGTVVGHVPKKVKPTERAANYAVFELPDGRKVQPEEAHERSPWPPVGATKCVYVDPSVPDHVVVEWRSVHPAVLLVASACVMIAYVLVR